ncbi:MAG: very short patch repair endonuclease [Candidatus Thiodiazotropha endolucinida]
MDILNPDQRSRCMSRIRGKNTKPELKLRKALWAVGLRYRLKNQLPGRPDIVFPGKKVAIFIDGCFWHRCPEHFKAPVQNAEFWAKKIERNVERDREVEQQLIAIGWHILRFWEHDIRVSPETCISRVLNTIAKQ